MSFATNISSLATRIATEFNTIRSTIIGVPSGGSSGQVLTKTSATDHDLSWTTPSGGGGSSAAIFMSKISSDVALQAASGTNPPRPVATINWNDVSISDTGYTNSSGEITIGSELDGKRATFNVCVLGDGFNNRTQVVVEIEVDTGSGFTSIMRSSNYNSRDSDQNEGSTVISGFVRELTTGEVYRIRVGNNFDGAVGSMSSEGTMISIRAED
jgi:hypothetical protein